MSENHGDLSAPGFGARTRSNTKFHAARGMGQPVFPSFNRNGNISAIGFDTFFFTLSKVKVPIPGGHLNLDIIIISVFKYLSFIRDIYTYVFYIENFNQINQI